MGSNPFHSGEHAVFVSTLMHGEECVVTNHRIIVTSPGEFHQVPLGEVIRVSAHVEAYLPWVAWARFFPVRLYRANTECFGAELVLECTSREAMLALGAAIERGALLADYQVSGEVSAGAHAAKEHGSAEPTVSDLTKWVEATPHGAVSAARE
jgi:hypothetical protein